MSSSIEHTNETGQLPEVLMGIEHIVGFVPGETFDLNTENVETNKKDIVTAILFFLNSPIIIDDFNDHLERREFRNSLARKNRPAFDLLETNRLRGNTRNYVWIHIQNCVLIFRETEPETAKIAQSIYEDYKEIFIEGNWDKQTNSQKVEQTQKFSTRLKELLDVLTDK